MHPDLDSTTFCGTEFHRLHAGLNKYFSLVHHLFVFISLSPPAFLWIVSPAQTPPQFLADLKGSAISVSQPVVVAYVVASFAAPFCLPSLALYTFNLLNQSPMRSALCSFVAFALVDKFLPKLKWPQLWRMF